MPTTIQPHDQQLPARENNQFKKLVVRFFTHLLVSVLVLF